MTDTNKEQLCPICQTGKETYELDKRSPYCPYIACHNGYKCGKYKHLKNNDSNVFRVDIPRNPQKCV